MEQNSNVTDSEVNVSTESVAIKGGGLAKYRYDAFISYRHTDLDKFVAENLHKQLEAFRLPKSIAKKRKGQKTRIERVFRDKEELPITSNLEDPIMTALQNSEWLIVICSPRLRESLWCKKEIETFIAMHGREHVMAVLIEGEPAESFPDELLYKIEKHTLPDGTVEEVKIPVEPLAADVRGKDKKAILKAMKTEVLRILAAMFSLSFDDLRQRHKEQRMKRIMTASLIGGAACLAVGVYSTVTAIRIHNQKEQIEEQAVEIQEQNDELAMRQAQSMAELASAQLESGDRLAAVKTATEALTESDGIALPYTPQAQYVLTDSLHVYETGVAYTIDYQYETQGKIDTILESPDNDTLAIYDDSGCIYLYDLENQEEIKVITSEEYGSLGSHMFLFVGNDKFIYENAEGKLVVYNLEEKKEELTISEADVNSITVDAAGKYVVMQHLFDKNITVYDGTSFEVLGTFTYTGEQNLLSYNQSINEDGIFTYFTNEGTWGNEIYDIHFVDLNTLQEIFTYPSVARSVSDVQVKDGVAYMISTIYNDSYTTADTYLTAIDIATGEMLWENVKEGQFAKGLELPIVEEAETMLYVTSSAAWLLDMKTGEERFSYAFSSDVVNIIAYANSTNFMLYLKSGEMIAISEANEASYDMSYHFDCKTASNAYIVQTPFGMVAQESLANKITVYTAEAGPEVVESDVEITFPEETALGAADAKDVAKALGLEQAEMVSQVYYNDDESIAFVSYLNRDLVIVDVTSKTILNTIEEAYPTEWYAGKDDNGNTYLLGYYGLYILDANMRPHTFILDACDVDIENQKVYMKWYDDYFEAPIYSLEKLLEVAEQTIEEHAE